MIERITIRERGAISKRVFNNALKAGYLDAAQFFHEHLRDRRFTEAHAQAAGYRKRKPEYTARKLKEFGHQRPLERTGETRDLVGIQYRLTSTSKSGKAVYAGARGFNRRHVNSKINMPDEFTRILPEENEQFAVVMDRRLQIEFDGSKDETTTVV